MVPEVLDGTRFVISATDGGDSQPVSYPAPADPADAAVVLTGDGGSVVFAADQELYRWRTSGALDYLQPPDTVTLGAPRDASITGRFVLSSRRGQNQAILEIIDLDGPTIPIVAVAELSGPQLSDQIQRLYLAYLGREPDPAGLNYWMVTRARGRTVSQVSSGFASSTEFKNTYGVLADEQFVDLVYENVLGRAPDAAGRSYWLSRLAAGMKRGALMTEFSEGPEFIALTGTTTPVVPLAHRIERLYRAYFDRTADQAGLDYWLERFSRGASLSVAQQCVCFVDRIPQHLRWARRRAIRRSGVPQRVGARTRRAGEGVLVGPAGHGEVQPRSGDDRVQRVTRVRRRHRHDSSDRLRAHSRVRAQ